MLQLKKVQILGFKSFCDRTEVPLEGHGIAAIVGPNGCGKSNISDAITWVLGEQSARSLRGLKMEDVIFAGTRERRPTGMAEVSLTLVDPAVYSSDAPASLASPELAGDWDEEAIRAGSAQETEDATADAQPGQTYGTEAIAAEAGEPPAEAAGSPGAQSDPAAGDGEIAAPGDTRDVILKVRRRKFGRTPVRAGEITVTRRLFRSGESEYLLNGKMCRLRDIQDIFLGTGLGGDSYAIIGQERIGQLLSARPLDRRSIVEEAAGITRFKAKKRLAELRLESARTNLSRINDIFEEVTRQVAVLKRQAAKAEKYGELRTEYVSRFRIVLASRLTQMDTESAALRVETERLGAVIDTQSSELATLDAEHSAGTARGYELDRELRDATSRGNAAGVDLERARTRITANGDRDAELTHRLETATGELGAAREALVGLAAEREQHRRFLEAATAEANAHRAAAAAGQARAAEAMRGVQAAEAQAEAGRRNALSAMQRANTVRNEIAQAEAALAGLDRENARLEAEAEAARTELEALGYQREGARSASDTVNERLKRLEAEIAELRRRIDQRRAEETQSRRAGDNLRAELATQNGRRGSLEALIREHSYSTDTVRNLFRAATRRAGSNSQNSGPELTPIGTLADFLEVDGRYENVVDEFLREELNYVVVRSWAGADEGVRLLHGEVAGRATFLVHPDHARTQGGALVDGTEAAQPNHPRPEQPRPDQPQLIALADCIRIAGGLGPTLQALLPRLRNGFIAPDSETARTLALAHPKAFFLSPTGETFHNLTVSGGKPSTQGPLALKRELAAVQAKVKALYASLAEGEQATAALGREVGEATAALDASSHERRDTEREAADAGASLRQMEGEAARLQRRAADAEVALKRNTDQRGGREEHIGRRRTEAERLEAERTALELGVADLTVRLTTLRSEREALQAAAAAAGAALAGLEERRRNAAANADRTELLYTAQAQRVQQIEVSIAAASAERIRRAEETATLQAEVAERTAIRTEALAAAERLTAEGTALRTRLSELDARLRILRQNTEALREQRATHTARLARLSSDLEHIEASCLNDLSLQPQVLRDDPSIPRIEAEALTAEDEAARSLRKKMEAMGPVNMMALEELRETGERHTFLTAQRADLLSSIENTTASIREIDDVSRVKFDEAFRIINENFSNTFTRLFGGGQAFMRLTETEGGNDKDLAGIDIIASPPGKKLQNILLLSGGEKALTALALLVGTFQFQPAPFCVLDEVDAPLDETNIGRFARLISEMSDTTQFVVITHSKRTMEQADIMYGVTMQEPGVSKIVSVSLSGRSRGKGARSAA